MGLPQDTQHDCSSYLPGHRLHWTQWKHASAAPHLDVMGVYWHEDGSFEILAPGHSMHWRHHDPLSLRLVLEAALDDELSAIEVSPQFRTIRVDGEWFNCCPAEAEATLCSV